MFDFFGEFCSVHGVMFIFFVNFVCHNRPWMIFQPETASLMGGFDRGFPLELVVENFVTKEGSI